MHKVIQEFINKLSQYMTLYQFIVGLVIVIIDIYAYVLARINVWLSAYGTLGVLFAVLVATLIVVLIFWLYACIRNKWIVAEAQDKWFKQVNNINPLQQSFNDLRINISDLVHPITREIANKKFVDCELIGPKNIVFISDSENSGPCIIGSKFCNCNVIVLDPQKKAQLTNFVFIKHTSITRGKIWNCNIFITPDSVDLFKRMGLEILTCEVTLSS